jgi:N-acetylglucosamine repressor
MEKATRQQLKEQNRSLVFRVIFEHLSISRAEIARVTGLTRTTVSDIVADLLAETLVKEIGTGSSMGGKSPILLSLADDSRYLIGLDLAHNNFCGAIVNLRGDIREMITLPTHELNAEKSLQAVYAILDKLTSAGYAPLVGIGVGTPGLVNSHQGIVKQAVNLAWRDLPLAQLLQDRYNLPVYLNNDCQAAAMGELIYGRGGHSAQNMIVIRAGHGIGSGIILNGELFHGDSGSAGEIGHLVIVREGGLPCRCGKIGCLETMASTRAVVQHFNLLKKTEAPILTFEALVQAFRAGDPLAAQVVLEAGRYLGMGIAGLIAVLNIHDVVLVGDMVCFGQSWLESVREGLSQSVLTQLAEDTTLEIGMLTDNGVILGASALLAGNHSLLMRVTA